MGDPFRMADHLRFGKGGKEGTAAAGMIDMDMGEEDIINPFHPEMSKFGQEVRKRRQGAGIDEKSQFAVVVKPGTDKFTKTRLGGEVEIDTDRLLTRHGSLLG
jgi:hypothetical protein